MRNSFLLMIIFFFLITSSLQIYSYQEKKNPIQVEEYLVNKIDSNLVLKFNFISKINAKHYIFINTHQSILNKSGFLSDSIDNAKESQNYNKQWTLKFPKDGYYCLELAVKTESFDRLPNYSDYTVYSLYFNILNNDIESCSTEPDSLVYGKISKSNGLLEIQSSRQNLKNDKLQSSIISVNISGSLNFKYNYPNIIRGIPVRIFLDWDYDSNQTTGYTPYISDERHVAWDDADMNGDFYFSFSFNSSIPANQISNKIRIYAICGNDACQGDVLHLPLISGYEIDISQSTSVISENSINIDANSNYGSAIRHLTRCREFTTQKFNTTLNKIYFNYIDSGDPTAFYSSNNREITFQKYFPKASTVYHEYGHYSHHCADSDYPSGQCGSGGHWFTKETNDDCAFTEGWAEFYSAACLDYWYIEDNTNKIEKTGGDYLPCYSDNYNIYQFYDYGQSLLCDNQNNVAVEGAVASFFYSLYDSYDNRFQGYNGDNEDLSFHPAFLRGWLDYGVAYARYYGYDLIYGYKKVLIDNLSSYQLNEKTASLNAFYNSLFNSQGLQRSATPTDLSVEGNYNSRLLRWNDNTCPDNITFNGLWYSSYNYDFFENNELGFKIFRKQMAQGEEWDGTLTDYSLIHTTSSDITSYSDDDIINSGRYSYVVVAYNADGISIPSAEKTIECSSSATPSSVYLNENYSNLNLNFSATNLIELSNSDNVVIDNSNLTLCSGDIIRIKDGTKIVPGSYFKGYISSCPGCSYNLTSPKSVVKNQRSVTISENYDLIIVPNPFNNQTTITISLSSDNNISLAVYDLLGNKIHEFANNKMFSAGEHNFSFIANNLQSGMFYVNLIGDDFQLSKPIILMK